MRHKFLGSSVVLTIHKEAVPLVRSGLAMKKAALSLNLKRYRQRLQDFEQRYRMDSQTFAARFSRGELGDEADWFEWEYVLQAYQETLRQLEILEHIPV